MYCLRVCNPAICAYRGRRGVRTQDLGLPNLTTSLSRGNVEEESPLDDAKENEENR